MKQLEIKYFWPLTEQIPLDLDYSDCGKKLTISSGVGVGYSRITNDGKVENYTLSTNIVVGDTSGPGYYDLGGIQVHTRELNWFGKLIAKLMGLDWKKK